MQCNTINNSIQTEEKPRRQAGLSCEICSLLFHTLENFRELRHRGDAAAPLDAERGGRVAEMGVVRRVVDGNFLKRLAGGEEAI